MAFPHWKTVPLGPLEHFGHQATARSRPRRSRRRWRIPNSRCRRRTGSRATVIGTGYPPVSKDTGTWPFIDVMSTPDFAKPWFMTIRGVSPLFRHDLILFFGTFLIKQPFFRGLLVKGWHHYEQMVIFHLRLPEAQRGFFRWGMAGWFSMIWSSGRGWKFLVKNHVKHGEWLGLSWFIWW